MTASQIRPLTRQELRRLVTAEAVAEIIGKPFETTHHRCHEVSLAIVRSGVLPGARVARGTCRNVLGQHSWVVADHDCYNPDAPIIDATLWSYDPAITGVWHGTMRNQLHHPHGGRGTIWTYGRPVAMTGDVIALTPRDSLSTKARAFLALLGPLDRTGWLRLANAPVAGWPAGEILAAISDTRELAALVPVDILGMLTDRNPGGLYLP